jgi:hypothetical protein
MQATVSSKATDRCYGGRVLIGPLDNEQIHVCYWTGLCYLVEAQ